MARAGTLPAKLVRPTQAGAYRRTRLFSLIDRCRPVCWVSGPPGAGKTTLVASYVDARRVLPLWYQLDEGDGDVATLFYYLRQTAVRASPRKRWRLPLLTPEYVAGLGTFTRRWFEELFAGLPRSFTLAFDNYHSLPADSRVHEVLRDALEMLPDGGRAMIVSRADPPATLARARAEGRMALVEWDVLRLTAKETAGIARARTSRHISARQARTLHAATDGWAAGLVLMLERASVPTDEATRDARPRQAVFEYFASEILAGSDDETRQVLLETALMPKVTAAQAVLLTGSPRAADILADLARRRYFTDCHRDPEPTYQYHPLFREFLLARAQDQISAEKRDRLRRKATTLLENDGQIEAAAELVRSVEDWYALAQIALAHAPTLLATGRAATLEGWLNTLPDTVLDASPWLLNWLAACRMPLAPEDCLRLATRAFDRFRDGRERAGLLFAASMAVDAILFDWLDLADLDRWVLALEELLSASDPDASDPLEARAVVALFAALGWKHLDHPGISRWAARAETLFHATPNAVMRLRLGTALSYYWTWLGDLAKARMLLAELDATAPVGEPELGQLWRMAVDATLSWIEGDATRCRRLAADALGLGERVGIRIMDAMMIGARTYAELIAGDVAAATKSLADSRSRIRESQIMRIAHQHYLEGWKAILEHDLAAAHSHAVTGEQLATQQGGCFAIAVCRLALAQTLFERGESEAARSHLADALQRARDMRSRHVENLSLFVKADFDFRDGDQAAGLSAVATALALGREHGFFAGGWWRRDLIARVCAHAFEARIEVEYARRLVHVNRLVPPADVTAQEAWPWHVRIRALGRFEVQIEDRPVAFTGRAQRKPLELLKALVAFGGSGVTERQIADALWPDTDGDLAQQSLAVTLHRLRKLLGSDEAIRRHEGRLDLDSQRVWSDIGALHASLERAASVDARERARLLDRALLLYRGPLLAGDEERWIVAPRERLRGRFVRELGEFARAAEERGETDRAIDCYLKALDADDGAEELYRRLIALYGRLGRRAEMLALYQRCRATLAAALGVVPSFETEALMKSEGAPAAPRAP